jgi:hypothetical protein
MRTLRTHMTHEMMVRGLANSTPADSRRAVTTLAKLYPRRPDTLSHRESPRDLVSLLEERHLAWATWHPIVQALRCFSPVT